MHFSKLTALIAGATALVAVVAPLSGARAVSIGNGGFELGSYDSSTVGGSSYDELFATSNAIQDWTVTSGSIDWIQNYWTPHSGSYSLDLNGITPGTIEQTVSGLTAGKIYDVNFWLAGNPDDSPTVKTVSVTATINQTQTYTFDITGHSRSDMGWTQETFSFLAGSSSVTLSFASTVTSNGTSNPIPAFGPALDDVSISERVGAPAETPLPAALPLFASGLGAMGLFGWRRRRKSA